MTLVSRITDVPTPYTALSAPGQEHAPLFDKETLKVAALIQHRNSNVLYILDAPAAAQRMQIDKVTANLRRNGIAFETRKAKYGVVDILNTRPAGSEYVAQGVDEDNEARDLFRKILTEALQLGASDIHWIVKENYAEYWYRVHGSQTPPSSLNREMAERLSRGAHSWADEGSKEVSFNPQKTQDARIEERITINGEQRRIQLRVASGPRHPGGFKVVMRIFPLDGAVRTLESLGYSQMQLEAIERMVLQPVGLTLLLGSTGSGKSTTLAAMCSRLVEHFQGKRNLLTIEQPPELLIPGAEQMPVQDGDEDKNHFAKYVRACMRQDPDILMVGEMRDRATAMACRELTETGHQVMSTVHAADPIGGIKRLNYLGIDPPVMADELFISGMIHQALVATLCDHCKIPVSDVLKVMKASDEGRRRLPALRKIILRLKDTLRTYRGIHFRGLGCDHCNGGIVGRTVLAEMLRPDDVFREHIYNFDPLSMRRRWLKESMDDEVNGWRKMDQAVEKMRDGIVSPEDVEMTLGPLAIDQLSPKGQEREEQLASG